MAQFYQAQHRDDRPVWVYSERGVLNFAFCALPYEAINLILDTAVNGQRERLGETVDVRPSDTVLLTEFGLGSQGFGNPDNALYCNGDGGECFVFIEAKRDPLARKWQAPPTRTAEELRRVAGRALNDLCSGNTFNSSLNGQLELKWRFANAFQAARQAGQPLVTEQQVPPPDVLMESDLMYWGTRLRPDPNRPDHWRRVNLAELQPLKRMLWGVERFYLLAITADQQRPARLDTLRLYDGDQQPLPDVAKRVFWLPFSALADLLQEVPA